MDIDNQENIYCADDNEYRTYCDICDKVAINSYYNKCPKSQTHIFNIPKRQHFNITPSYFFSS